MNDEINKKLLNNLVVYQPKNNKIKIGNFADGGYVLIDGYHYDLCVSCGIGNEFSFDVSFINQYRPNIEYLAFDGSVQRPSGFPSNIQFFNKFISWENTENTTNLEQEIEPYNNIFLKMDIEGWEWKWLKNKSVKTLNKFKQITIEVHGFFDETWTNIGKYEYNDMLDALEKLNKTHYLVHFHGNNAAVTKEVDGKSFPTVGEAVYIRKVDCEIEGLNKTIFPVSNLDYPNYPNQPDIILDYWPFITNDT